MVIRRNDFFMSKQKTVSRPYQPALKLWLTKKGDPPFCFTGLATWSGLTSYLECFLLLFGLLHRVDAGRLATGLLLLLE
jgi:hypothetical protein